LSSEYLNNKAFEEAIIKFQNSKREKTKYRMCIDDMEGALRRGTKNIDLVNLKLKSLNELYKEANKNYIESQNQLAISFLKLSENIVKYAKFNLIDMYDAIQEGVMICFEKIDRFDPIKGKAFNYMTTCCLNHFRQLYRTAKNYNELKKRFAEFQRANTDDMPRNRAKNKKINFSEIKD
jgi:DNA-directed RNA polymerase specialized sigma subunit